MIKWNNILYIFAMALLISAFLFVLNWAFTPEKHPAIRIPTSSQKIDKPIIDKKTTCVVDYMINGEKHHQSITSQYMSGRNENCFQFYNTIPGRPGMILINTIICSEKDIKIECEEGK